MHPNLSFAWVDVETATCSDCASGTCPSPILPNILKEKKLTSGYMGIFSDAKPEGISSSKPTYLPLESVHCVLIALKGGNELPRLVNICKHLYDTLLLGDMTWKTHHGRKKADTTRGYFTYFYVHILKQVKQIIWTFARMMINIRDHIYCRKNEVVNSSQISQVQHNKGIVWHFGR